MRLYGGLLGRSRAEDSGGSSLNLSEASEHGFAHRVLVGRSVCHSVIAAFGTESRPLHPHLGLQREVEMRTALSHNSHTSIGLSACI